MPLKILYILRVCGNAGGMETYVYQTARALIQRGHEVHFLCASATTGAAAGITLHITGPIAGRRSWEARWNFRAEVSRLLPSLQAKERFDIVHSHDNTREHTVATQHGPCVAPSLKAKPWKLLDPSARRNLGLERDKFHAPGLAAVVGCSQRVCDIVRGAYPVLKDRTIHAIPPAFSYMETPRNPAARWPLKTLGFLGYDWKRKGLPRVIEIFRQLHSDDPEWSLRVGGVSQINIPWLLRRRLPESVTFLGHTEAQAFYDGISVLLHPARDEPFGMVIPEALSRGVPVLASDQCGCCAHIDNAALRALPLQASDARWSKTCAELETMAVDNHLHRSWTDVAREHEHLYLGILKDRR